MLSGEKPLGKDGHDPSQLAIQVLSPREAEVLAMTADGLTNSQIAAQLGITVHSVKFHLASVFRKLSVGNRTEAAVAYLRSQPSGTTLREVD
jgi:DNA-binding CsgD family transcriptional regulator